MGKQGSYRGIAAVLLTSLTLAPTLRGQTADGLPEGRGKNEVSSICQQCHDLTAVTGMRQSKDAWTETVDLMRDRGATATDEQAVIIVAYLAEHFGPQIEINRASAADLQSALQLTPEEAAALVKYRHQHGPFKDVAALLKVAGVDAKKIQAQSGNFVFEGGHS